MLKENWRFIGRIERLADILITIICFYAAYYGRDLLYYLNAEFSLGLPLARSLAPIADYHLILITAVIVNVLFLNITGAYGSMRLSSSWQMLRLFTISSIFVFITIAAVLFIVKADLSRSFIGLFCLLLATALTFERVVMLKLLRYWRRKGYNYRNIIICGISEQAVKLAEEIAKRPEIGIRVRGYAELRDPNELPEDITEKFKSDLKKIGVSAVGRIIHGVPQLTSALKEYAIDEVIFANISDSITDVEEVMLICAEQGVRTTIAADLFSIGLVKSGLSYFGHIPLIHFQTPPGDRWELVLKRILDICIAAVLLIVLSPLLILTAVIIKLSSKGPIIFKQKRVGFNGHHFNMYKFRSMYADAEERFADLQKKNEMKGPAFKIKDDPRITPFGKFIRRHSIDELPQLWNVLIGNMSLVGPRPPVPGEVSAYERKYRRRLSMRPGLTCTWQVSGRNRIKDFEEWVQLDLDYIDNWSLGRDISLIFKTIPAVIFGTGAR